MEIEFTLNLDKICRVCLDESNEMKSIFDSTNKLSHLLMYSCGINVSKDDGLPSQLCVACTEQVNHASDFKKRCTKTDIDLRKYIEKENTSRNKEILQSLLDEFALSTDHIELGIVSSSCLPQIGTQESYTEAGISVKYSGDFTNEKTDDTENETKSLLKTVGNGFRNYTSDENHTNCSKCTETFNSIYERKTHELIIHKDCKRDVRPDGVSIFLCPFCDEVFNKPMYVLRHVEYHREKSQFSCRFCKCYFKSYLHIKRHKKRSHKSIESNSIHEKNDVEVAEEDAEEENNWLSMLDCKENDHPKIGQEQIRTKTTSTFTKKYVPVKPDFEEKDEIKCLEIDKAEGTSDPSDLPDSPDIPDYVSDIWDPTMNHSDDEIESIDLLHVNSPPQEPNESKIVNKTKQLTKTETNTKYLEHFGLEKKIRGKSKKKKSKQDVFWDCCKLSFESKKMLDQHLKEKNNEGGVETTMENRQKEYKTAEVEKSKPPSQHHLCSKCGKEFKRRAHLNRHIPIHSKKKQSYTCPLCNRVFKVSNHLQLHVRSHRDKNAQPIIIEEAATKKQKKAIICTTCGKSCSTPSNYAVHMRRHNGTVTCRCSVCGKGFARSTDLKLHMRRHTGEKPYTCSVCNKKFVRSDKLAVHMRIHTGERPFACQTCGRSYKQSNDLKTHQRRVQCHGAAISDPDNISSNASLRDNTKETPICTTINGLTIQILEQTKDFTNPHDIQSEVSGNTDAKKTKRHRMFDLQSSQDNFLDIPTANDTIFDLSASKHTNFDTSPSKRANLDIQLSKRDTIDIALSKNTNFAIPSQTYNEILQTLRPSHTDDNSRTTQLASKKSSRADPNNIIAIEGMTTATDSKISDMVKQNLFLPYLLADKPIKFDFTDYSNSLSKSQFGSK